jgi:hypothetical protein
MRRDCEKIVRHYINTMEEELSTKAREAIAINAEYDKRMKELKRQVNVA